MQSSDILISGLTFRNSGFWTTHIWASDRVEVSFISIFTEGGGNTDGFDPDSSSNVHIHNCIVYNDDDCISVKSGMNAEGSFFEILRLLLKLFFSKDGRLVARVQIF